MLLTIFYPVEMQKEPSPPPPAYFAPELKELFDVKFSKNKSKLIRHDLTNFEVSKPNDVAMAAIYFWSSLENDMLFL